MMHATARPLMLWLSIAPLLASTPTFAAKFTPIGDLPGGVRNTFLSTATVISGDGGTVGGRSLGNHYQAISWTETSGLNDLGLLSPGTSAHSSNVGAMSYDGSVIVGQDRNADNDTESFIWTAETGMVGLGSVSDGNGYDSAAIGVSADGSVVVGATWHNGGRSAYRWTEAGGMIALGDLAGGDYYSRATGVSADGNVITGSGNTDTGYRAFIWTDANGMLNLGSLSPSEESYSHGISADGTTIFGSSIVNGTTEAFVWTEAGGMAALVDFGGYSSAYGASADGSVIVGYAQDILGDSRAVMWTDSGIQILDELLAAEGADLTGWELTRAYDVSDDGNVIVGVGINPDGRQEGFVVNLTAVPVPAAAWLFGSALFALGWLRRR